MTGETDKVACNQGRDEVPFSFEELFFSRTDSKGIILSGNSVFVRISLYTWEELYRKPHNVIRHPDMPKGVFALFWDFLKKGKPVGAYVKNRAKDGRHYWVFAIATPVEGGFLSVRIKPGSDIFPVIQNAYKQLLAYEHEKAASPKESMETLLETLKTLGFGSYEEFMSVAVAKELAVRDVKLDNPKDMILTSFSELTDAAQSMIGEVNKFYSSYEDNKYVPLNLQIQSFQLGDMGKTIGVISGNYDIVSSEIRDTINDFNGSAQEVFNKIYEGQFLACTARIQKEVIDFFRKEQASEESGRDQEISFLQQQQVAYQQKAADGLRTIMAKVDRFQEDCRRMKMCASSLEVIRVMGKVDVARLNVSKVGLSELVNDLKLFQEVIAGCLAKIEQINGRMKYNTQKAVGLLKTA